MYDVLTPLTNTVPHKENKQIKIDIKKKNVFKFLMAT